MDTHTEKYKVRLGLFIAGGILIFTIAIFFIGKQQNLFNPIFKVTTNFYNVSGLQVGNSIRFSGITVGTVDNIQIINDSTVQVDMLIRKNVQEFIKADSEAGIGSEGIIGDRVLIITQGSNDSPMVEDGQHIKSKEPVETDAIIASLQTTTASAEDIMVQLAEIMLNINSGQGTLGRLIQDTIMAENINLTIKNFKKSSEGLDHTIEVTKENVFEFMEKLQNTASKTEVASIQLGEIMTKINNGEGTLGMLIQDTIMAANFNLTLVNLKNSSKGLDDNMEALKHNFFFRRYYKKQAIEDEKKRIELELQNPDKDIPEIEEENIKEDTTPNS